VRDDEARDVAAAALARDLASGVVPGGGGAPSPLSVDWIERELRDARGTTDERKRSMPMPPPSPPAKKDLDAKIEMLRKREEEVARANAERTRIVEEGRIATEATKEEEARWVRERMEEESRRVAAAAAEKEEEEREESN